MKRIEVSAIVAAIFLGLAAAPGAGAQPRKAGKAPPQPLNKQVQFEPYEDTDLAMITYLTTRQEFRVGHPPYPPDRFHLAEFVIISDHTRKYLRPDLKAEIRMAPNRSQPELMQSPVFQKKWKAQMERYQKTLAAYKAIKIPKCARAAFDKYAAALEDEIFLAQKIEKHMFASQQIRSRELLRQELSKRFRSRDADWFDRLLEEFEQNANLEKFYPRFVDLFVETALKRAQEEAEQAMKHTGLEYATAAKEEEKDFIE